MSKHTPGPWMVYIEGAIPGVDNWAHQWPQIVANGYCVVGTEGLYGDFDTDMANAKLIAAAPDLLQELIAARKTIAEFQDALTGPFFQDQLNNIDAAIKKATE